MANLKKESLSGIKWNSINRIVTIGLQFFLGIIIARQLQPDDYGLIGILSIFMSISQSFIDSGFSLALIRKEKCLDVDYSTVFYFNIFVGVLIYGILFSIAPFVASFFNIPLLKSVLRIYAIVLIVNSFTVVHIARLKREIDFKTQTKVSIISMVFSGGLGVFMAYNGYGVWTLVYQSIAMSIMSVILLFTFSKWKPIARASIESFKEMFSFGSKTLMSGLLTVIYENLSTVIIGKFYTSRELGLYSRGNQLATMPSMNISSVLQQVSYSVFSKAQDSPEELVRIYRKYISLSSFVIFFLMSLLAVLSKPLIMVMLTEKWVGAAVFTQIFCFSYMFSHISHININLLLVEGRSDLVLKLEIIKKTISLILLLSSIPFGVLAICASRVLYTQIGLIINTYYTGQHFDYGYWSQIKDYFPYFIKSIIAVIPVVALFFIPVLSNWLLLIMGTLCSVLVYWFLNLNDDSYIELKSLLFKKNL